MIRLAVLGMMHETNTYSSNLADLETYNAGAIHRGDELIERFAESQATIGGFLRQSEDQRHVDTVPLIFAGTTPCGMVTAEAYDTIVGEMRQKLNAAGPFDGVLLALHGACVAENHKSADADIAAAVRATVGPGVPIGVVLDMHANFDPRLLDYVDVVLAYQTNPHVDPHHKAAECRALIVEMIRTGVRPTTVGRTLPLACTITRQGTADSPVSDLLDLASQLETEPGAIDVSLLLGFQYADVPHMGMSVLATHSDRAEAERLSRVLADAVWQARTDLQGGAITVDTAASAVEQHGQQKPILLLDIGDNIGAGGPGDSMVPLSALLDRGIERTVTTCRDRDAISSLRSLPVGASVQIDLGGASPECPGPPLHLNGTIAGRHNGPYRTDGPAHGGFRYFDGGEMVALTTPGGTAVVVTSKPVQPVTPAQLRVVGLDPLDFRAIYAKGVNGPLAGYADICGKHLAVDTPGITRASMTALEYRHRRRPMFPFEPDACYP